MQVALVGMDGNCRIAEAEHGEQPRISQQRVQRITPVFDAQAAGREGAVSVMARASGRG